MPTSTLVPGSYEVALNGRPYNIDWEADAFGVAKLRRETIPLLRQQADQSAAPGEASLNPEGFWRRVWDSWHHGMGQSHRDRPDSDPYRFRYSKGIDCWTKYELKLLNDVVRVRSSTNPNIVLINVGGAYLYITDGTDVYWTSDSLPPFTWHAASIRAGETAATLNASGGTRALASDGSTVYCVFTDGIHSTAAGASVSTHYADNPASAYRCLGFVKGRLMAGAGASIYNIVAAGAAPAALYTHPSSACKWSGFAEGPTHIYAAGGTPGHAVVMKMAMKADGSGLDVPSDASVALPAGEGISCIFGAVGLIFIGTTAGWRVCEPDANGNLTIGPPIPIVSPGSSTPIAPLAMAARDRFVFVGDSQSNGAGGAGLGRGDLSEFIAPLAPAYNSDIFTTQPGAADVTAIDVYADALVFAAPSATGGVYMQDNFTPTYVDEGTIDFGITSFGLPDNKIPISIDTQYNLFYTGLSHTSKLALDGMGPGFGDVFETVAAHAHGDTATETSLIGAPIDGAAAKHFEIQETLATSSTTHTPKITRETLKIEPAADGGRRLWVPVLLYERLVVDGAEVAQDPAAELAYIDALRRARTPAPYQEGKETLTVILEDYEYRAHHRTGDGYETNGTALLQLKEVA